jgi:hypothetical protein
MLTHFLIDDRASFFGKFEISTTLSVTSYLTWRTEQPRSPSFDEAEDKTWIEALPLFSLDHELPKLVPSDEDVG